ncbi:glutathione S-transferase family protein [Alcanivorax sp. S6407]|uniref:glutathione S-transferase family protein n=1 Tax=Alcanivorax sp. S6407 TaxID=2926424 RepID=UPI001FF217E4|nr:glutathione S-transferase family protein [Alcanivorax sp. S6407]MCK0154856.1 glutathione S-transferase family protein [Alcanivorax sp. S6407]
MSELILHHYLFSPFSEKVRAMLGYAGLSWQSVEVREMPPRPLLAPLAGGYRKIPVAQIGADIFCDTRAIGREIARLSNKPELAMENCPEEVQEFIREVDLDIFLACIITAGNLTLLRKVLKESGAVELGKLLWDRVRMGSKAKVKANSPGQMKRMVRAHLDRLESMLANQPFLFGDTPNAGDFSAYHSLWFQRDLAEQRVVKGYPKVNAWLDRLQAFGQGNRTEISPEQALEIARSHTPRAVPESDNDAELIGQSVSIAPTDYGREPVSGTLVASNAQERIIVRDDATVGEVANHFPSEGFSVRQ